MCGGTPAIPPDRSVELRQIEIAEERRRAEEEAAKREQDLAAFNTRLGSAYDTAVGGAGQILDSRGLDQDTYLPLVLDDLQLARTSVPELDPNPGQYFTGVVDEALNAEQDRQRANYLRQIDQFAPTGFEQNRIVDTMDDDAITAIIEEDMRRANQEAQSALDRGVITQTGYDAALGDIGNQRFGVEAGLQDLGRGVLDTGRADLSGIGDQARQAAQTFSLGNTFDPLQYKTRIDQNFANFSNVLSDRLRGRVTPSSLFDTSNLFNVAGAAQGAQNTGAALVGGPSNKKDEEDDRGLGATGAF